MKKNNAHPASSKILIHHRSKKKRFFQIDALKAIMIALVIMDHSFSLTFLHLYGAYFWERISIPIFLIIMGFNLGKSYQGKNYTTLKEYYNRAYFESKLKRYMIPYLLLYLVHGIMRIIINLGSIAINSPADFDIIELRYIGYTFFYGPGLWFIPVLFGTILVFPVLYHWFKKAPVATFVGTYVIEFLIQGIMILIVIFNNFEFHITVYYFLFSTFAYFSAIGIGLWFSVDHEISSKHNRIIWILFPISVVYMVYYTIYSNQIYFPLGDYQFFFFPYSAVIFMLGMKFFPKNPKGSFSNFIRKISQATYHILLSQIFYLSIIFQFFLIMNDGDSSTLDVFDAAPLNYLWFFPLNLIITFGMGLLWKNLEEKFYRKIPKKRSYQIIYNILIKIAIGAFIAWIVGQIWFLVANLVS